MKVGKYAPAADLAPYVKEYLVVECAEETASRTLPDTSMVMAFRFGGSVQRRGEAGMNILPATSVSGLRSSFRLFHYAPGTGNLLVLFREAGLSAFTRLPLHELFEQSIISANLFRTSELDTISERLAAAVDHSGRVAIMDQFLRSKLITDQRDLLVSRAVQTIQKQSGILRVKDLADSLYISQDPFEKRFRALVGASPKQYASIVRLRSLLNKLSSFSSLTEASYEAGYFDQSHFIRDFRRFTGQTPGHFLRNTAYW